MKKILNWVLTATLVCGANVFTACTTDSSDNPTQEQAKKNRTEFIKHTRENLKNIAENLNFTSWEIANRINQEFNTAILTNPEFEKTISNLFVQKIKESVKPVEEGSELAEMGYKQYATIDLTKFNYRFTMKEDGSGFDVEEADDFEMIINGFDPQTLETKVGGRKLTLKAGGDTFKQLVKRLSTKETAVVSLVPSEFTFTIAGKVNDSWHDGLIGVFNNKANMSGKSELMNLNNDAFNVSGILTTIVGEMPGAHSADATELAFTFSNGSTRAVIVPGEVITVTDEDGEHPQFITVQVAVQSLGDTVVALDERSTTNSRRITALDESKANKTTVTGTDGKQYTIRFTLVNGKPVLEYEEVTQ